MRTFAPFAVFCLSAFAAPAGPLLELRDPAKIAGTFASAAPIRVLNVWATWCVPCVEEMSDLRAVETTFGPNVAIVGLSLDDMIPGDRAQTKQKVTKFLQAHGIRYRNVYYVGSADALADALHFSGEIPITIIFDREGRELWRQQGKLDRQKTIGEIRKLLGRSR